METNLYFFLVLLRSDEQIIGFGVCTGQTIRYWRREREPIYFLLPEKSPNSNQTEAIRPVRIAYDIGVQWYILCIPNHLLIKIIHVQCSKSNIFVESRPNSKTLQNFQWTRICNHDFPQLTRFCPQFLTLSSTFMAASSRATRMFESKHIHFAALRHHGTHIGRARCIACVKLGHNGYPLVNVYLAMVQINILNRKLAMNGRFE